MELIWKLEIQVQEMTGNQSTVRGLAAATEEADIEQTRSTMWA